MESDDVDFDDEFFTDSATTSQISREARLPAAPTRSVFNVEQKSLNPDNELKKIFGSKIVQSGQKKKARGRAYVKSAWLMNPKENWAQIRKTGFYTPAFQGSHPWYNFHVLQFQVYQWVWTTPKMDSAISDLNTIKNTGKFSWAFGKLSLHWTHRTLS